MSHPTTKTTTRHLQIVCVIETKFVDQSDLGKSVLQYSTAL